MLIMLMMTRKIRMIKTMITMMNLLVKRLPGNVDDGASVHSGTSDWGQRARNTVCTRSSPTLNLFVALNLIVFLFLGLVFRRPSPNLNWFQPASKVPIQKVQRYVDLAFRGIFFFNPDSFTNSFHAKREFHGFFSTFLTVVIKLNVVISSVIIVNNVVHIDNSHHAHHREWLSSL